jgi:hypothetical protein
LCHTGCSKPTSFLNMKCHMKKEVSLPHPVYLQWYSTPQAGRLSEEKPCVLNMISGSCCMMNTQSVNCITRT